MHVFERLNQYFNHTSKLSLTNPCNFNRIVKSYCPIIEVILQVNQTSVDVGRGEERSVQIRSTVPIKCPDIDFPCSLPVVLNNYESDECSTAIITDSCLICKYSISVSTLLLHFYFKCVRVPKVYTWSESWIYMWIPTKICKYTHGTRFCVVTLLFGMLLS